ncbi:alpha-tocopherol transfer protein-like [Rhipicephalus sanguineus]|uniref:alpha-tocopherol transfer protein-like n=1 Tax=Rhipicephalus sanguineus TaxID=34632 RepID=UPI0020C4B074|nr:alpha-tocopherol transfer protein-like [Rhipicephalus sanguineus]
MEEELEVAAREELGETPELRKESVDKFRELLQEETDLRPPPDYVLLMFLRARKYNMDNAMKSLKAFFRIRTKLPEYYDNHLPSALDYQTVVREHKLLMLSKDRDSQGRAVGLVRLGAWNGSICSFNELLKWVLIGVECALLEDETQIRGIMGVLDLAGLGVHHIIQMTPRLLRLTVALAQDTYPCRPKALYIVNTPAVFEGMFYLFVKPFLSKKLKTRVHLLKGGLSELCGVIPSDLIPEKYGGTLEQFDFDRMERYLLDKSRHFEIIRQCGYATNCSTT